MEEEVVSTTEQTTEEVKTEQSNPVEQLATNYEALCKQQQAQIEQLIKQQELTNKVNQQLNKKVAQLTDNKEPNNEHWVDRVLREEFRYENSVDPLRDYNSSIGNNAKGLATWWLQYNKSKGLSNDEIATKYKKMAEFINTGRGPHEVI